MSELMFAATTNLPSAPASLVLPMIFLVELFCGKALDSCVFFNDTIVEYLQGG
jgi:hypothetical protein